MKRILFGRYVFLISIAFALAASGQTPVSVTPEMRAEANRSYQDGDWTKAAAAYEKIVELEQNNIGAQYRLGLSLLNANKASDAIPHLERAMTSPNTIFALALARAYARTGNRAKAYEVLDKSTTLGGIPPETLTSEKDFSAWQNDSQFKDLVNRSDLAVNPCKAKTEFRQFDFWIGDWDVKTPQGLPAGSSSVQLILGQCIIFENWTGGAGTNGKSFNIFDVKDSKWHQTWVDDKGTFTHYIGALQNGDMVVIADTSSGEKALAKMTFSKLPNGDVRQHGENSTDDGKTWTTTFDLIYSRKK